MARETKDEKILREAREQAVAEAALEAYLLTVPKRLMDAQALAQSIGVAVNVSLTATGPSVHFYDDAAVIDDTLTYQTESWELEYLERKLRDMKIDQEARIYRRGVAQDVFATLSREQKDAIIENIHYLR
jgi:hypothetical protein